MTSRRFHCSLANCWLVCSHARYARDAVGFWDDMRDEEPELTATRGLRKQYGFLLFCHPSRRQLKLRHGLSKAQVISSNHTVFGMLNSEARQVNPFSIATACSAWDPAKLGRQEVFRVHNWCKRSFLSWSILHRSSRFILATALFSSLYCCSRRWVGHKQNKDDYH